LDGGITNRNYRVHFGGDDYVVRLPGKDTNLLGIDREAERLATKHAAELGIGPKVAAMLEDPACLVTCFVEGRELTSGELRDPDALAEVARGLRSYHESDIELPTRFHVQEVVREYAEVTRSRDGTLPAEFEESLARADEIVATVADDPEHASRPNHNDLLAANFLQSLNGIVIVDWEYAGMGDPFFDLGNFSVNHGLTPDEDTLLLAAYDGDVRRDRLARLTLMRVVSDFREAMWGVLQQGISTLDVDFAEYAGEHFDRLLAGATTPGFERALREAAG
ncbi:MAG: phosphotransferase, partial [Chloroflexota bacterium]